MISDINCAISAWKANVSTSSSSIGWSWVWVSSGICRAAEPVMGRPRASRPPPAPGPPTKDDLISSCDNEGRAHAAAAGRHTPSGTPPGAPSSLSPLRPSPRSHSRWPGVPADPGAPSLSRERGSGAQQARSLRLREHGRAAPRAHCLRGARPEPAALDPRRPPKSAQPPPHLG